MTPGSGDISSMYALSQVGGVTRGPTGNTVSKSFTPSKPGDDLRTFAVEASASTQPPANDTLQAIHGVLPSVKTALLDRASLTSKVMLVTARVPEALRECYPLTADDCFVSTYYKWAALYKSIQKTVTVDQANIDQLRKSYFERLISALGSLRRYSLISRIQARSSAATACSRSTSMMHSERMLHAWPSLLCLDCSRSRKWS